jgi:uncharacterized RDD family membrane protein YckC
MKRALRALAVTFILMSGVVYYSYKLAWDFYVYKLVFNENFSPKIIMLPWLFLMIATWCFVAVISIQIELRDARRSREYSSYANQNQFR